MKNKLIIVALIIFSVVVVIVSSNAVLGGAQAGNTYQLSQDRSYSANGNATYARSIYIIPADWKITQAIIWDAQSAGCSEIAQGIPPRLAGVITRAMLPYAYHEPKPMAPLPQPPAILHTALVAGPPQLGNSTPLLVSRTWNGNEYLETCYITQQMYSLYWPNKIKVGDTVIVTFLDGDINRPLAIDKLYIP